MESEQRLKEEWSKLQAAAVRLQEFCQKGIDNSLAQKDFQSLSDLVSYITTQTFFTGQLWGELRDFLPKDNNVVSSFSASLAPSPPNNSSEIPSSISSFQFTSVSPAMVPVPTLPKFEPALDAEEVAAAMAELDKGPWQPPASKTSTPPSSLFPRSLLSMGPSIVKSGVYATLINRARRQRKGKVVHPRLQKRCSWCQTESTPEWRTGPEDCILCNACGLQFRNKKKVEEESKKKNNITNLLN